MGYVLQWEKPLWEIPVPDNLCHQHGILVWEIGLV